MTPILKRDDDLGMAEAFGRDPLFEKAMRHIVRWHGIKTVIETGTWRGYTTRKLAEFVPYVHTIEVDPATAAMARETLAGLGNVTLHEGTSPTLLPWITLGAVNPILYFLDAHWKAEWPLFDELDAIARFREPCVIVIHDCQVPGRDFGYDAYDGKALTFELVKPWLDRLRFPWRHSFNFEAEGHRRGVLLIEPVK